MFKKLLDRIKEPSSLAGMAMLAALFGIDQGTASALADALVALVMAGTAPNPYTVVKAAGACLAVASILVSEHKPPLLIVKGRA